MKKNTKNLIVIFVILMVFLSPAGLSGRNENMALAQANWNDSMYSQYNYSSFAEYRAANSEIDFRDVDYNLLCAAIFYATNKERATAGLAGFEYSFYLEGAAMLHAYDMVKDNFFDHENPYDPSKKTPFDRMAIYYVTGGMRAENIAYLSGLAFPPGDNTFIPPGSDFIFRNPSTNEAIPPHTYNSLAAALLDQWMHSPGHRANIVNSSLTYLGCGAAFYNDPENYGIPKFKCVQNFGSIVPQNP